MTDFHYDAQTPEVLEQLQKGAFLTVTNGEKTNTMTIGWATFGYVWKKPVLTVYVRQSRYTAEIIKKAADFTVSIPLQGQLKKELGFAGKNTGRKVDKFAEAPLETLASEVVASPAISGCNVVYECKMLAHHALKKKHFADAELYSNIYADNDIHTVFYGEIVNVRTFE